MGKELFFNESGLFKIIQFTDIHFSDDNDLDHQTTKLMHQIILNEKPDFIFVTGDTVFGENNAQHISKALEPIISSGVLWSCIFGNHDTEEGDGYECLFKIITSLPNCVTYDDDPSVDGIGNHYLEVKNQQGETKWLLFGLDSGNYNDIQCVEGYDYIKTNQIDWYKQVITEVEKNVTSFSSLVFMHIPLPEYNAVWDKGVCCGNKREDVCCPEINSGFFAGMLEVGHSKGVFVGHDHINDYMGELYGINLAYGRAVGYNTYGEEGYLKGARMIQLRSDITESFETYIRLEDGSVIKNYC